MKNFNGKILFLDRSDINTDEIIPAKYLTELTKAALKPYCLEGKCLVSQMMVLHCGEALPRDYLHTVLLFIFRHELHPSELIMPLENRDKTQRHKSDISNGDDGSSRIDILRICRRYRYRSGQSR